MLNYIVIVNNEQTHFICIIGPLFVFHNLPPEALVRVHIHGATLCQTVKRGGVEAKYGVGIMTAVRDFMGIALTMVQVL